MNQRIPDIVKSLTSISLTEMDDVSLMKRTDTKFVIHENQLISVLDAVKDEYNILEIDGKRIMSYSSLYFDTKDKKFYKDHHNGKVNRTKIRIRKYVDSDTCFLEIKQKDGKGNTTKTRASINDFEQDLSDKSIGFINEITNSDLNLEPIIWNQFNRITLVNKIDKERLTVDLNLSFEKSGSFKIYNKLVIIEVKQERFTDRKSVV